ncbi:MAG: phage tail spike protein [Actinomycetaceae bacterium]|nr:phage tail spike protein [Actinomycetaceae bacterium]
MISVHDRFATTFTSNGLGMLDGEVIDPVVREELNGAFTLSFTYPANAPLAQALLLENIVACPVPGMDTRQGFRISERVTTVDGLVEVTCLHLFYDLAANLVADTFVVNKTPKAALDQILAAANTPHRFTATSSDASTVASARLVRVPVAGAVLDGRAENSFVSRWGGQITRDNFHIHHAPKRGKNRGVVIRDRKNLTGYTSHLDYTTITTRILPVGYDGLLLPELYVDSPRLNDYVAARVRVIRYGQVKAITDPDNPREGEVTLDEAHGLLRRLAAAEYFTNHIDKPQASYRVSFTDLASTREYADLAQLETVLLGDTVTVEHADLEMVLTARVVAYDYNPLTEAYLSVELGSAAAKFTDVTRTVTTAVETAQTAETTAGLALASADGKTTNHYGPTQPTTARLGDTWFKPNGETIEIWVYTTTDTGKPGWISVATDLNHAQVTADLEAAKRDVAEALDRAGRALTGVDDAQREIAAKVDKAGVVASINISPENNEVRITGRRIHLTGATVIDNAIIGTGAIRDAAITNAKIASLDASKITTGTLAAGRIAAGSITSDKLTIANGFIQTAMIRDAAITSAKIASLDAGKITTGYLNAGRIQARSITADKLASNAIQVGLAGWKNSIRISPTAIEWWDGTRLQGRINKSGMHFYHGTTYLGWLGQAGFQGKPASFRGLNTHLADGASYAAWTTGADTDNHVVVFTLDPKGKIHSGQPGIHLGANLYTRGNKFYTAESRPIQLVDTKIGSRGTFPAIQGANWLAEVVFQTHDLYVVTNGTRYNLTREMQRLSAVTTAVNTLIQYLNRGWITTISGSGGNITWRRYDNTGLSTINIPND